MDELSEQDLLCNFIVSAADSTWANWEPRGEFVTEKHFFAIGAMSWMDFFVRNLNTHAVKPRGNLGQIAAAAAAAVHIGDYVYIPPYKYYLTVTQTTRTGVCNTMLTHMERINVQLTGAH